MQLCLDTEFHYPGYEGQDSKCHLRAYQAPGAPTLVIATELPDNPGTSVTNRVERLAEQVWELLERPEAGLVWGEHYLERGEGAS